jgi:predicted HAD superfamily Cof-like phosphohydrolase
MNHQQQVKQFHDRFGLWTYEKNQIPATDDIILGRISLIVEELAEFIKEAHGWSPAITKREKESTAKELADLAYVVYGAAVEMGIDLDKAIDIVHESNMSKVDGKLNEATGKYEKGPSYIPPDMSSAI